jgi:hypothetical protein
MSEESIKSEQDTAHKTRQSKRRAIRKAIDALMSLAGAGFVSIDDISDYFAEIETNKNDRSVAILLGTTVENALQSAIEQAIRIDERGQRDLFNYDRPLGTFAAKIMMAHALHIFGDETRDKAHARISGRSRFSAQNRNAGVSGSSVRKSRGGCRVWI